VDVATEDLLADLRRLNRSSLITDPESLIPESLILNPGSRIPDPGSRIPDPEFLIPESSNRDAVDSTIEGLNGSAIPGSGTQDQGLAMRDSDLGQNRVTSLHGRWVFVRSTITW